MQTAPADIELFGHHRRALIASADSERGARRMMRRAGSILNGTAAFVVRPAGGPFAGTLKVGPAAGPFRLER